MEWPPTSPCIHQRNRQTTQVTESGSKIWRTRFAPSPSGHLHLGHLVNALYIWSLALKNEGQVLLRIEDHDLERSKSHFIDSIYQDLEWLKLDFIESPLQSSRYPKYQEILDHLIKKELAYPCNCSRKQIMETQVEPSEELVYPGTCRNKKSLEGQLAYRLRILPSLEHFEDLNDSLRTHLQSPQLQCGDFSLKDKRGNFTYQFCASVDDIADEISVVIRGLDLFPSTGRQILLRRTLLDLGTHFFPTTASDSIDYYHHPLIMDSQGSKLSKRDLSKPLHQWREEGWSPEELFYLCLEKINHPLTALQTDSKKMNINSFSQLI